MHYYVSSHNFVLRRWNKERKIFNLEKRERKARLALPRLLAEDVAQALDGVGENERYQLPLHLRVWTLLDCLGFQLLQRSAS